MSLIPTKVGGDRKQIVILGALVAVLLIVFLLNRTPDGPQPQAASLNSQPAAGDISRSPRGGPAPPSSNAYTPASLTPMPPQRGGSGRADSSIQDFRPSLKLPEGTDIGRIDPSLRLDLMAKLRNTPLEGGERSLFEFGAEPRPPLPHLDPVKPQAPPVPVPSVAVTPAVPVKPPPPPIPLKFYGYVSESQGPSRRAFFLDGEDIVVAGENETIHNRYKVIRIGVNSAVIEDTTTKNQQTIPLIEELPG